jgi:2,4-dienoyl-CoA reductase-like NADH-dependent reductase (Old Yellow Enzyme family)/thioredoxin reductase
MATTTIDTSANSTFGALFRPGFIADLELRSRVLMAPMEKNMCTSDGVMTQAYIDYLVERAGNEVGLLRVEATYVDPVGKGRPFQVGAQGDHVLPQLERACAAIHAAGGLLSLELAHCGRQSSSNISGFQPVAPSPVPCVASGGWMPRELTVTEIAAIVERFAAAAARIEKAGVDVVEIHGASGYLVNAFLSPYTNLREDEYGGSFENRMRFPLEVVDAIRGAVSVPVTYRLDAEECVPGGLTTADTAPFAAELERHGIAMIDAATGTYEAILATQPPMEVPPGSLLEVGAAIKAAVDIPVATTGRLGALEVAEEAVANGVVDFVSIARGLHADPELLTKAKEGRMSEARRCIACAECVAFLSEKETTAYCAINAAAGREAEFELRPAAAPRKVLVVGAGPAGMEAARVAALRGHQVSVYERSAAVGGRVRQGALAPGRDDFGESVRFLARELERLEVPVELGAEVTPELVAGQSPDVVIVATGGLVADPRPIPGLELGHVVDAFAFLRLVEDDREAALARGVDAPVAVVGGNWVGCVIASILLDAGRKVDLIEPRAELAYDFSMQPAMPMMDLLATHPHVTVHLGATLESIDDGEVTVWSAKDNARQILAAGQVVVVPALDKNPRLHDELAAAGTDAEIHALGDCVSPRKLQDAIFDAAVLARDI